MYHTHTLLETGDIAMNTNKTYFLLFSRSSGAEGEPDNKLINKKISILSSEKCYAEQSSA